MPYPVLSFSNPSYAAVPAGTQRVSLRISAPYPVQANAGVGAFRKPIGATSWTSLTSGGIDNSSATTTPDDFELKVDPGYEYAFTFKGAAMAVTPGANVVEASFELLADNGTVLHSLGSPQRANGAAAGIVGTAYFRT